MKDEGSKPEDLRDRTKRYAVRILLISSKLPKTDEVTAVRKQMIRSGPSAAAHYREACRARSNAGFI